MQRQFDALRVIGAGMTVGIPPAMATGQPSSRVRGALLEQLVERGSVGGCDQLGMMLPERLHHHA